MKTNYKYSLISLNCSGDHIILHNVIMNVCKTGNIDTLEVICAASAQNLAELLKVGMSFTKFEESYKTLFLSSSLISAQR